MSCLQAALKASEGWESTESKTLSEHPAGWLCPFTSSYNLSVCVCAWVWVCLFVRVWGRFEPRRLERLSRGDPAHSWNLPPPAFAVPPNFLLWLGLWGVGVQQEGCFLSCPLRLGEYSAQITRHVRQEALAVKSDTTSHTLNSSFN